MTDSLTDLSEAHVLFDGVDASLEVSSGSIHVGDHRADVTDDGGENQHADLEEKTKYIQYKNIPEIIRT